MRQGFTKKLKLFPYNLGSNSAKLLAQTFNCVRVRPDGAYKWFPNHIVINWGNSVAPKWATPQCLSRMLNKPSAVAVAADKVRTFQVLQPHISQHLPEWTTNLDTARKWLEQPIYPGRKHAVLCRTLTRASEGRGIILATSMDQLVSAPLYTRYKPKSAEFRVHVFRRDGVVDVTQKRRRTSVDTTSASDTAKYIRSYDNGWVFCRDGINVPEKVRSVALSVIQHMDLDFGAVDVGYDEKFGITVYEVNTAPGIEGTTLESYARAFKQYLV